MRLKREVSQAEARGELAADLSPRQIAFQPHAYITEANWARQLLRAPDALGTSRTASRAYSHAATKRANIADRNTAARS